MNTISIENFYKINWQNIPDFGMYSEQLVDYIQQNVISFFQNNITLTPDMINNYVKTGIMPKPFKKKYYRKHIASLIIIIILKQ